MPHQRLRNRSIHRIHGHVVSVIGRPAERKLRQISCSNNQTILAVCNIHQHLRAFSRLCILIGDIVLFRILSDILKVLKHRSVNAHLLQRGAEPPCQLTGVSIGSVRRAEAGHGHRADATPRKSKQIEAAGADQKRERGIQPA